VSFQLSPPFTVLLFICGFAALNVSAQEASRNHVFIHLQSQDIELPEDFMARVDGNKLQVTLASLGAVESQPSTASMLVRLLNSKGEERVAIANSEGVAEFDNVNTNELHALLVADESYHAAIPIMTMSSKDADAQGLTSTSVSLSLMPANPTEILASINRDIVPSNEPAGELYASSDYRRLSASPYKVRLQKDGRLIGKVIVSDKELSEKLRYASLTFMRNNQAISRVSSNPADGSFVVPNLTPGVYGVIAAGPAGYASFAFDVLPASATVGRGRTDRETPVAFVQQNANDRLFVFLCPPKIVPTITDRIRQVYRLSPKPTDSVASGGAASNATGGAGAASGMSTGSGFGMGGYGGGGGFVGGGGGGGIFGGNVGGILGIAGLATAAGILAADQSSDQPASPIIP
jgi:uncharacterized membrane protein YgcG